MKESLYEKRIVLLGIGHTNAHVLRHWAMKPIQDTELVCISDHLTATYSGMLPAVLAQQRPETAMTIDLVRLCAASSARLLTSPVTGINTESRTIFFDDRPSLEYDFLSIGVGSETKSIESASSENHSIPIKPMQTFTHRLRYKIDGLQNKKKPKNDLNLVVVGGGIASIEIVLCIRPFIETLTDTSLKISIVTASQCIAAELPRNARDMIQGVLAERDIEIIANARVVKQTEELIELDNGSVIPADLTVTSTGASAPKLLEKLDLPKTEHGFLSTHKNLQSTGSSHIFAVGDCGSLIGDSVPKSGVYAVRQGPVLWENLNRSIKNQNLVDFTPQKKNLKLINLGDGRAIAHRGRIAMSGHWAMRWKHRIDDRFISMFSPNAKPMSHLTESTSLDEQCRGCGCKLDSDSLNGALKQLNPNRNQEFQDAVVIQDDGQWQTSASIDFFTAPFPDAYLSGRIAALHSLSDLVASGAMPRAALSTLVLSDGPQAKQQEQFRDITAGINQELKSFGIEITGGHTIVGPRTEIGLTVLGKRRSGVDIGKHRLNVGEKLFLTKPLGTGILMAANMRGQCSSEHYHSLLETMLTPLHPWLSLIQQLNLTAVTDVTGFGLAGHLLEMLNSSNQCATINFAAIPILPGISELLAEGIESTLAPGNRKQQRFISIEPTIKADAGLPILFDPQTCGGLLFSIATERIKDLHQATETLGLSSPIEIGSVIERKATATQQRLWIQ